MGIPRSHRQPQEAVEHLAVEAFLLLLGTSVWCSFFPQTLRSGAALLGLTLFFVLNRICCLKSGDPAVGKVRGVPTSVEKAFSL